MNTKTKNDNRENKKRGQASARKRFLALLAVMTLVLAGCGSSQTAETGAADQTVISTEAAGNTAGESAADTSNGSEEASSADAEAAGTASAGSSSASAINPADLFSERDHAGTYDESEAQAITLNGTAASSDASGVTVDGGTVTITAEGVYVISGTLDDGMIIVDADGAKVQLVLNNADITSKTSAAIYVKQADKVFVTLAEGSSNSLTNGGTFTAIDENDIDAVIFAKDDITLNGSGSLTIESPAGHGVVSKDELTVTGGTYTITAAKNGLSGKDSIAVSDGTFNITAGADAVHGDNDEDSAKGFVYIGGGTFTISAGDDGIHSSSGLAIVDGTIDIAESYEGLEGLTIDIRGGAISLKASDDGLNAAGGNDGSGGFGGDMFAVNDNAYISIAGGTLNITASGDGIDSNGNITVSGGTTIVSGPDNSGNGAFDYNGTASITGGTLIAAGASGMAQNFSSADGQAAAMISTGTQQAGTAITVKDSAGNVIAEMTAEHAYDCVVVSAPEMQTGDTVTVAAGTYEGQTELTDAVTGGMGGFGGGMNGGKGGMNGGNFDGGRGNRPDMDGNSGIPEEKAGKNGKNFGGHGGMKGKRGENTQDGTAPQTPDNTLPEGTMPQVQAMPEGAAQDGSVQ